MEEFAFALSVAIISDVIAKVLSPYIENGVRRILTKHRSFQKHRHTKTDKTTKKKS